MKQHVKIFEPPVQRFDDRPDWKTLSATDHEHTPYNRTAGSIRAGDATFRVQRCSDKWVEFELQESVVYHTGKSASRTISIAMQPEQAQRFARFILTGE